MLILTLKYVLKKTCLKKWRLTSPASVQGVREMFNIVRGAGT